MVTPGGPPAGSSLDPQPPLVGRDRELRTLRAHLAAALAGRGSLVLIGGEAGIGKTALAEALLAEAADRGALVLVGRCYDLSETPPYGPWADMLGRAPRDEGLPAAPDLTGVGVASQTALFARMQDWCAALAGARPLVVLLDDLHWADPASLDLLRHLARHLVALPLLALVTYRADELTRRHPLHTLLPLLVREARAARIDLRPLDAEGLLSLVGARYRLAPGEARRLATYLGARAEGNPFYAGELLRTLEEERALRRDGADWWLGDLAAAGVPALLRQVIDARVDRLGEEARRRLALAAVIGQAVPLALWAAVAGTDEDTLLDTVERATEARLLLESSDGSGVRFAHALIREALVAGVPPVRRRALHRRIAEALAAGEGADPDAVAYRFQCAVDPRAVDWLIAAGERASAAFARLTAAHRFEAALALLRTSGGRARRRGWLLIAATRNLHFADVREGLDHLEEATRLAADCGDRLLAAHALGLHGAIRDYIGEVGPGLAELREAVAAFEGLQAEPDDLPHAIPAPMIYRRMLIRELGLVGRFAEMRAARAVLTQAGDVAFTRGGPGHVLLADGVCHAAQGRPQEAKLAFAQSRRAYDYGKFHDMAGWLAANELRWLALPYFTDRLAEQRALAEETATAWTRANEVRADLAPPVALEALVARLPLLLVEGAWSEARRLVDPVLRGERVAILHRGLRGDLARLVHAQGGDALAWSLVLGELPDGPDAAPGDTDLAAALILLRVAAALALGADDLAGARHWLAAHDHWLGWCGAVLGWAEGQLAWAAYHRAAGNRIAAREDATRALAHATDPRQPLALLAAHRALGELAVAGGDRTIARAHLDQALALAGSCAAPYERALTLLALAELQVVTGERPAAGAALTEANAILEPLAACPALARAAALTPRLEDTPAVAPAPLPFGLTPREAEGLRLVAEGLTDPQAAERLFVSRNTIGSHLKAVYGKLGVNTRAAATRLALEHGLA